MYLQICETDHQRRTNSVRSAYRRRRRRAELGGSRSSPAPARRYRSSAATTAFSGQDTRIERHTPKPRHGTMHTYSVPPARPTSGTLARSHLAPRSLDFIAAKKSRVVCARHHHDGPSLPEAYGSARWNSSQNIASCLHSIGGGPSAAPPPLPRYTGPRSSSDPSASSDMILFGSVGAARPR